MNARFYICRHCGNLIGMIRDAGVPVVCCGEKMEALTPNEVEAGGEKHVPVVTVKEARKKPGTQKPALWIITQDLTKQPDQPWRADKTTPVILIAHDAMQGTEIVKNPGKLIILSLPVSLNALRDAAGKFLS